VIGTSINVAAIMIGGVLGLMLGSRLPERVRQTVISGLGLFTLAYGFKLFIGTQNALAVLSSLLVGVLVGEVLQIDRGLHRLGSWHEARYTQFIGGVRITVLCADLSLPSLVFCVGRWRFSGRFKMG